MSLAQKDVLESALAYVFVTIKKYTKIRNLRIFRLIIYMYVCVYVCMYVLNVMQFKKEPIVESQELQSKH